MGTGRDWEGLGGTGMGWDRKRTQSYSGLFIGTTSHKYSVHWLFYLTVDLWAIVIFISSHELEQPFFVFLFNNRVGNSVIEPFAESLLG